MNEARRALVFLEPLHSCVYFAPECSSRYEALGLAGFGPGYFCSRSAPMGRCSPETVQAAFGVFAPAIVRPSIEEGWSKTDPATLLEARFAGVTAALERFGGRDAPVSEALDLVKRAVEPIMPRAWGRPLFAGHSSLEWPDDPLTALWHGLSLWREYRGDGHILAWTAADLDAVEILILSDLWAGLPIGTWVPLRSWTPEEQDAGVARLEQRGLVKDGAFTDAGRRLRSDIEDETDRLAALPVEAIDMDDLERLLGGLRQGILDGGGFPVAGGRLDTTSLQRR